MIFENNYLKLELNNNIQIVDKQNNITWTSADKVAQWNNRFPEVFGGQKTDEWYGDFSFCSLENSLIKVKIKNDKNKFSSEAILNVELDDHHVYFNIIDFVGSDEDALGFPPSFNQDTLVIPNQMGVLLQKPFKHFFRCFYCVGLSMPWFAGLKDGYGYIAVFETPADAGVYTSEKQLHATPTWRMQLGKWGYPRRIRYSFFKGDYVKASSIYREYAKKKGLVKTLKEKINDNPLAMKLSGSRYIKTWMYSYYKKEFSKIDWVEPLPDNKLEKLWNTYSDVKEIIKDCKKLAIENAILLIAGWSKRGYDNLHPDNLPPYPKLGTEQELKELFSSRDYIKGIHDNYQDMYDDAPSFPTGIRKLKNGKYNTANIWDGGLSYILNSRYGLYYAQRNIPKIKKYNLNSIFVDTTTSAALKEDWDEQHPQTRKDDLEARSELLRYLYNQPFITGTESAQDWAVPFVHFFEGIMAESWYPIKKENYFKQTIPLFWLVYHDCVSGYWHQHEPYNKTGNGRSYKERLIWDQLFGNSSTWVFKDDYNKSKKIFQESLKVENTHKKVFGEKMIDHKILTDDGLVHMTEYSNNIKIYANFGNQQYSTHDGTINPQDILIIE